MSITRRCLQCGEETVSFTNEGVPVDTSSGSIDLVEFACDDLEDCNLSALGDIPTPPVTGVGLYDLVWNPNTLAFTWEPV